MSSLLSEWLAACPYPSAWLSLDARDGDSSYFLRYLIAALQSIDASLGASVWGMLQSSHPPSSESILTVLINEISNLESEFVLILDDYHLVAAKPIDDAMSFLLEHLPANMHLVMVTREEPSVPLARLRARGQLTELRQADLRFTLCETTDFLKESINLELSDLNIAALEAQTETCYWRILSWQNIKHSSSRMTPKKINWRSRVYIWVSVMPAVPKNR